MMQRTSSTGVLSYLTCDMSCTKETNEQIWQKIRCHLDRPYDDALKTLLINGYRISKSKRSSYHFLNEAEEENYFIGCSYAELIYYYTCISPPLSKRLHECNNLV